MLHKIEWVEEVESQSGKKYKKVTLAGDVSVSCWPDFSKYAEVIPGGEVEGIIQEKGKYKNLVDGNLTKFGPKPNEFKAKQIEAVQTRTSEMVKMAQDNKADNIKLAAANRDATLILTTFYPEFTNIVDFNERTDAIKKSWIELRDWLLKNGELPLGF